MLKIIQGEVNLQSLLLLYPYQKIGLLTFKLFIINYFQCYLFPDINVSLNKILLFYHSARLG